MTTSLPVWPGYAFDVVQQETRHPLHDLLLGEKPVGSRRLGVCLRFGMHRDHHDRQVGRMGV